MANKKKAKKTKLTSKKVKKAKGAGKSSTHTDVGQQMLDRGVVTRTGRIC